VTDEALRPNATPEPRNVEGPAISATPLAEELPGRYQLGAELARGGQSVVYVAYDAHLGREVAFKTLLPEGAGSTSATLSTRAARFVREARVTAQLEHPGIAPVHEVGQARTHGQEEVGPGAPPVVSLLDGAEQTRDGAILGTPPT
jgi:serine/threonine protein kinase